MTTRASIVNKIIGIFAFLIAGTAIGVALRTSSNSKPQENQEISSYRAEPTSSFDSTTSETRLLGHDELPFERTDLKWKFPELNCSDFKKETTAEWDTSILGCEVISNLEGNFLVALTRTDQSASSRSIETSVDVQIFALVNDFDGGRSLAEIASERITHNICEADQSIDLQKALTESQQFLVINEYNGDSNKDSTTTQMSSIITSSASGLPEVIASFKSTNQRIYVYKSHLVIAQKRQTGLGIWSILKSSGNWTKSLAVSTEPDSQMQILLDQSMDTSSSGFVAPTTFASFDFPSSVTDSGDCPN